MHKKVILSKGPELAKDGKVLVIIHGRGADPQDIVSLTDHLNVPDFSILAPSATNNTWYPYSFMAPAVQNEPWLSSAIAILKEVEEMIVSNGIRTENIFFLGFSQGACLTLEYTARNAKRYGGVIAFTGGLIGSELNYINYKGNFDRTPIYIGTSDPDPHVPIHRVNESSELLKGMGAKVELQVFPNMGHTINEAELDSARKILGTTH